MREKITTMIIKIINIKKVNGSKLTVYKEKEQTPLGRYYANEINQNRKGNTGMKSKREGSIYITYLYV